MTEFKVANFASTILVVLLSVSTPSRALTAEDQYQADLFQEMSALPGTYTSGASGKSVCKDMSAGGITVSECIRTSVSFYDENTGNKSVRGGFGISNGTAFDINSFAVGTLNSSVPQRPGIGFSNPRFGWSASYMTEANWDSKYGTGSFDTYFGSTDTGAYVYSNRPNENPGAILPYFGESIAAGTTIADASETLSGLYFVGPYGQTSLHSNFLAWSSSLPTTVEALSTNLLASSGITTSVPEPAPMAMMTVGLLALVSRGRRERARRVD